MFKIYQAANLEELAEKFRTCAFGNRKPGLDLTPVTVINQTRGIADWLRVDMAKSGKNGLAMNLDMLLPNQFVRKNIDRIFNPEQKTLLDANGIRWRIFREFMVNSSQYPELASFLHGIDSEVQDLAGDGMLKAWQLARKTADLFDNYQLSCQPLIQKWRQVESVESLQNSSERWLCRIFRNCFGKEPYCCEEYLYKFIEDSTILPQAVGDWQGGTIHIFGVGAMRNAWFRFFHELGKRSFYDVNFFYLAPSKEYFADQFSREEIRKFSEDEVFGNVIFQNNCRQGRLFFQTLLDELDEHDFDYQDGDDCGDTGSALKKLQYEITSLHDKKDMPEQEFKADGTIAFHNCHSMRRQVEVLHDQLLMAFKQDNTLMPSDVLVMAPDIDAFAPYIHSVFSEHPNLAWRISICDRALLSSASLLNCFIDLLQCATGICSAEEILALLEHPAMQIRCGIEHSQLPEIRKWVKDAGIRWGCDAAHHEQKVDCNFREFSWLYGLQRIMMGIVRTPSRMPEEDGIAQMEIFSGNQELLFAFSAFVNDFLELRRQIIHSHTFAEWQEILVKAAETFVISSGDDNELQEESSALCHAINHLVQSAVSCGMENRVPVQLIIAMLKEHFSVPGNAHNFISDKLTFCSMRPMRSIPKRIIAILGMNENAFPKRPVNLAFDLSKPLHNMDNLPKLLDNYTASDEDRYMFLETILAAREKLWFFYNGRKSFNEDKLECATPLAELIEYLNADKHIVEHPRHAFSSSYFTGDSLKSINHRAFNIASKLQANRGNEESGQCAEFENAEIPEHVDLYVIQKWLENPCVAFVKQHYGLDYSDSYSDEIPAQEIHSDTIDNLTQYDIVKEILKAPGNAINDVNFRAALGAKCMLPPTDYFRQKTLDAFREIVPDARYRDAIKVPLEVKVTIPDISAAITVSHRLPCFVDENGTRHFFLLLVSEEKSWKNFLRKRLTLAFLRAALPAEQNAELHILQFDKGKKTLTDTTHELQNTDGSKLADIVAIYLEGQKRPLPIFPATSYAAAEKIVKNQSVDNDSLAKKFSTLSSRQHTNCDWNNPAVIACGFTRENITDHLDNMLVLIEKIA